MPSYLRICIVSLIAGLGPLACGSEAAPSAELSGATELGGDPTRDHGAKDKLDDTQIATVLHVVNEGEIRVARFALKRATREDVRDFASRMEMDHTKADEKLRALFGDALESADRETEDPGASAPQWDSPPDSEIPVAPSKISRLFEHQTVLDLHQLRLVAPPEFDLGYITKQVAAHAGVLGVIDQHLMPSVQRTDLRDLIKEVRPEVGMHLESATAITLAIIGDAKKGNPPPH